MGKKSVRENKNMYQQARETAELTREKAGEQMVYVSADRIEKIESGRSQAHPDEVLAMADCYKAPALCNYYCSHECAIGQKHVPEVQEKELSQIVLEMLASLNVLNREKERLIEITVDGEITEDEYADFVSIRDKLVQISASVDSMLLWIDKTVAEGKLDREALEEAAQS